MNLERYYSPYTKPSELVVLDPLDKDTSLNTKYEMTERLMMQEGFTSLERAATLVQLLSFLNIDMPSFYKRLIGFDDDSAFAYSREILETMCQALHGFSPSEANNLIGVSLPPNRLVTVYHTDFLAFLADTIGNNAAHLAYEQALEQGFDNDFELINLMLEAYENIARLKFKDFRGNVFANHEISQTVSLYVLGKEIN